MAATPLVVLLHGQPGSSNDFVEVQPYLAGLPVLAVDRPGYDADGVAPGGFWYNARVTLEEAAQHTEPGAGAVLVGYSWGAGVALAAALLDPAFVRGLVLVCPVGTAEAISPGDRLLAHRVPALAFRGAMTLAGRHSVRLAIRASGSRLPAETVDRLRAAARRGDMGRAWRAWQVEQRALVDETPQLQARLGEVTAPAVVISGRRDQVVPAVAARAVARSLGNTTLTEIEAGHLVPFEAPQVVGAAVREVLERLS